MTVGRSVVKVYGRGRGLNHLQKQRPDSAALAKHRCPACSQAKTLCLARRQPGRVRTEGVARSCTESSTAGRSTGTTDDRRLAWSQPGRVRTEGVEPSRQLRRQNLNLRCGYK